VYGGSAIALLIDDPAGPGGVAEAAVGGDPVEGRRGAFAVAITHLVEPEVLGMLEEGDERFAQERQDAIGGAVGVLNPPRVPGGAFDEAVPLGLVEHGEVLQLRVRLEHAARCVEQSQVFEVAAATVVFAVELRLGGGRGRGWSHGEGRGDDGEGGGLGEVVRFYSAMPDLSHTARMESYLSRQAETTLKRRIPAPTHGG